MAGILIFILKLVGWLLLFLLGLAVVVLVLVLLVPIPYRIRLLAGEGEPPRLTVRVFGFRVFPRPQRKTKKKKTAHAKDVPSSAGTSEDVQDAIEEDADSSADQNQQKPPDKTEDQGNRHPKKRKAKKDQGKTSGRGFGKQQLAGIRRELTDAGNHRALSHVWQELSYLLRHFGPRRVRGEVSYSMGDPANTGYVTAALSVCPFAYSGCRIYPDFAAEKLYVQGELDVRGHVRLMHALRSGLGLLLDKDIRNIIHKVRN
jgi:hypothetical protein